MKRREALEKTGWILKSAVFTPGLISAIQSCQQQVAESAKVLVLSGQQQQLANAIADTIIPKTDTPSASEVKVVQFLDLLLKNVFNQEVVDEFVNGLGQFDEDCKAARGKSYKQLDQTERTDYLTPIDLEVMEGEYDDQVPFYYTFKKLCITIYFSTEQGVKQNLNYQPVPGGFEGDTELKAGDRIMVGNQM